MAISRERIIERVRELPDNHLQEVDEFVSFLEWRAMQQLSDPRDGGLMSIAGTLSGRGMSSTEIERELYSDITPQEFYREMIDRPEIRTVLNELGIM